MKFFIPIALLLGPLFSCTPGAEQPVSSVPEAPAAPEVAGALSLEGSGTAPEPTPAPASADATLPAPAPAANFMAGLRALDAWHRGQQKMSDQAPQEIPAAYQATLHAFLGMQSNAKAYRASLKLGIPTEFGPSFAGFAEAYAAGGLPTLATALNADADRGPAWMVWSEAFLEQSLASQDYRSAGITLGVLIPAALEAGYDRQRVLEYVGPAGVLSQNLSAFLSSTSYTVQSGDSLWKICRGLSKEGNPVNSAWLMAFNGKSRSSIRLGETLKIPTAALSVKIWRDARILAVYADATPIRLLPASVGKKGEETPLGRFTVGNCLEEPVYWPQDGRGAIPFGSPDNPLGTRWIGFVEKSSYGIHGTNSPETIGSFESEGCVRLANEAVEDLFGMIAPGVTIHLLK